MRRRTNSSLAIEVRLQVYTERRLLTLTICEDAFGHRWCGTSRGVDALSNQVLTRAAVGATKRCPRQDVVEPWVALVLGLSTPAAVNSPSITRSSESTRLRQKCPGKSGAVTDSLW